MVKDIIAHLNYPNLNQISTDFLSQLYFLSVIIIRAVTAIRLTDNIIDDVRSNQSKVTEKILSKHQNETITMLSSLKHKQPLLIQIQI